MRLPHALTILLLTAACYSGADAPTSPEQTPRNDLRILGGLAECDACSELSFDIGGPDLSGVGGAAFVGRDAARTVLPATIELRRFTGDSGVVLQAHARFTGAVPTGEYDLQLLTPGRNLPAGRLEIPQALRVVRARQPAPGDPVPPDSTVNPPSPPPPPPAQESGSLSVLVTVVGAPLDGELDIRAGDQAYEVAPNSRTNFVLPVGLNRVEIFQVWTNCSVTGTASRDVMVSIGATVEVEFTVTCAPFAYVQVAAAFSGAEPGSAPWASCEGGECNPGTLSVTGRTVLKVREGAHRIVLNLPLNCQVSGSNPVDVMAAAGDTVRVDFTVSCVEFLVNLTVTTRTTGPVPSTPFRLSFGYDGCDDYWAGDCAVVALPGDGRSFSTTVPPGPSYFLLDTSMTACIVTSPNPVRPLLASGTSVTLTFEVTCP